jgi:ABC-type sugar transport system substrate-binding protein
MAMAGLLVTLAAAAAMAQAAPTPGPDPSPAPAAAAAEKAAKPAKPEKVCVEETQMGSHFKRRICATPDEWERRRRKDQDNLTRARGNSPTK